MPHVDGRTVANSGMKVEGTGIVRRNVILDNHHDAIQTETGSRQQYAATIGSTTTRSTTTAARRGSTFLREQVWPTGNVFKTSSIATGRLRRAMPMTRLSIIMDGGPGVNARPATSSEQPRRQGCCEGRAVTSRRRMRWCLRRGRVSCAGDQGQYQAVPSFVKSQPSLCTISSSRRKPGHDAAAPLDHQSRGIGSTIDVEDASYFTTVTASAPAT
jgi:hypothetical protein